MKKRKILSLAFWIIMPVYIGVSLFFSSRKNSEEIVSTIKIHNHSKVKIIEDQVLVNIILKNYPNIIGEKLNKINLHNIEKLISQHPAINESEVYTYQSESRALKGKTINIDIIENKPIARLFSNQFNAYINYDGKLIPKSINPTRLIVFTGSINNQIITNYLVEFAQTVYKDKFLNSLIEQVDITNNNEVKIYTKFSDQVVFFGKLESLKSKLYKLKEFYLTSLKNKNFAKYKSINLKFKNQVVCSK